MSIYSDLIQNPPKFDIYVDATEVVFTVVSSICDNVSYIIFKQFNNEFKIKVRNEHALLSLSNYQMKGDYVTDLKWAADDQDWDSVIDKINSGTCKIQSVRSR